MSRKQIKETPGSPLGIVTAVRDVTDLHSFVMRTPRCYFDLNRRYDSLKLEDFVKLSWNKCGNGVEFNDVVFIYIYNIK